MAAVTTTGLDRHIVPADARSRPSAGLFSRALDSLRDARIRAAEREIARFIETKGGRLTDDLERQIGHTFL